MRSQFSIAAAVALAASLLLSACREGSGVDPTHPSMPASTMAAAARIWTENYTFINPQGGLVTREQRLANLGAPLWALD